MSETFSWPVPPERGECVVRLRPGDDPADAVVLTWAGERFIGRRRADGRASRLLAEDPLVFATPGLFDVQINGYWGRGFKDVDLGPEGVRALCWSILLSGTTRFLPTITTDAPETMGEAMANIHMACQAYPDVAAMVAGIHQEGPWISPVDGPRGAHPLQHISLPHLDAFARLQEASGGRIRLVTVAPEIGDLSRQGVVVSLGHHRADTKTIQLAVEAGARCVTHLGNGCLAVMPRHPNVVWDQAAEDRLCAGLICDGQHLPPATVKVLYRAKPPDKLILVSDAVNMAGAPVGLYHVRDAIAEMTASGRFGFYGSPILMGAAVPLARCLANFCAFVDEDKTPVSYVNHVTTNPDALLGLSTTSRGLGSPGASATFVVWRWDTAKPDLVPQRIVVRGRTLYDVSGSCWSVPFGRSAGAATPEEGERWLMSKRAPRGAG